MMTLLQMITSKQDEQVNQDYQAAILQDLLVIPVNLVQAVSCVHQ